MPESDERGAALVRSNAVSLPLRDDSVDLIVTSPPYFALRSYTDEGEHYGEQIGSEATPADFLAALWAATEEFKRVLKPTGSIFVNLGDKYAGSGGHNNSGISTAGSTLQGTTQQDRGGRDATKASRRQAPDRYNQSTNVGRQMIPGRTSAHEGIRPKSLLGLPWRYAIGCIDHLELILRAEIVWAKTNGMPESVGDRVRRSHEQWFHFTKEPHYFADMTPIREPHAAVSLKRAQPHRADPGRAAREGLTTDGTDMSPQSFRLEDMNHPDGRLPGSVWSVSTEPLRVPAHLPQHFAAFPQEWPRKLILGWSPPGGVVLDPFGGTGTTAMVARALGRFGISNDLSADYLRLAEWRVFKSGQAVKTINRTNQEAQMSLIGGAA
jgi:hypothetical protein